MNEKATCKNCTEEMIEEMAKIQCDSCKKYTGESEDCNSAECLFLRKKYANELIKQDYRKIPEGSVVLTKEEYERLKGCENTIKRFSKISPTEAEVENKALKEEIAIILAQKKNVWELYREAVGESIEARKETAKEILSLATKHDNGYETDMTRFIGDLKKQYGVDIKD